MSVKGESPGPWKPEDSEDIWHSQPDNLDAKLLKAQPSCDPHFVRRKEVTKGI